MEKPIYVPSETLNEPFDKCCISMQPHDQGHHGKSSFQLTWPFPTFPRIEAEKSAVDIVAPFSRTETCCPVRNGHVKIIGAEKFMKGKCCMLVGKALAR